MTFTLDRRLAHDGIELAQSDNWLLNLVNDSRYIWVVLIPKVSDITEIYQLTDSQQLELIRLSTQIGQRLMEQFNGDKLNVAAIGNIVNQLHLHHVVRFTSDEAWPAPIWGVGEGKPYTKVSKNIRIQELEPVSRLISAL